MTFEQQTVSLVDIATYLPENRVPAEWYTSLSQANDSFTGQPDVRSSGAPTPLGYRRSPTST